ncbi:MAG: UTP--glucose-1-phosphate uridylyltransferase, partial [Endomicrobiia bacterium]
LNLLIDKVVNGELPLADFLNKKIIIARNLATTHIVDYLAKYMATEIFTKRFAELQKIAYKQNIDLNIDNLVNNIEVQEVNIGFKYMSALKHEAENDGDLFLLAIESSGGISIAEWIYDKCGFLANIMLLISLVNEDKQPQDILDNIYNELGYFPAYKESSVRFRTIVEKEQPNLSINDIKQEAQRREDVFKNWVETATVEDMNKLIAGAGENIIVTDIEKTGEETLENLKVKFSDNSWLVLRLSGTEPLVRVIVETKDKQLSEKLSKIGEEIVKGKFKEIKSPGKYSQVEIATAQEYARGEMKTEPITEPVSPTTSEDVFAIRSLSQERQHELERKGIEALLDGKVVLSMLMAGASSRMNVQEAPEELKAKVKSMKSKAAVPIDEYKGLIVTYFGIFGTNIARLFEQIEAEAKKEGISNPERVWENVVSLLTNNDYISEHQQLLDENNYYGLKNKKNVRFFTQPLGVKYNATVEDVRKMKKKFNTETEYYQALLYAAEIAQEVKTNPEKAIYEGGLNEKGEFVTERDPLGHGEYFHQMVYSGELMYFIENGMKYLFVKNVDNYAAKLDKTFLMELGLFIEKGYDWQSEVSERTPGIKGGSWFKKILKGNTQFSMEDPTIEATKKAGYDIGDKPSFAFNNGVGFGTPNYVINLYKKEGQSTSDFISEYRQALKEKMKGNIESIEELVQRGRARFPKLLDPKPAKNITEFKIPTDTKKYDGILTSEEIDYISQFEGTTVKIHPIVVKVETNMWQSTGVSDENIVSTVEAKSGRNIDIVAYLGMSWQEKKNVLEQLRFLATKSWDKTATEKQAVVDAMNQISGAKEGDSSYISSYNDPRVVIGLETYQANKIISDDLLRYITEESLITDDILSENGQVYTLKTVPELFRQTIINSIESLQRIVLSLIFKENIEYTMVSK